MSLTYQKILGIRITTSSKEKILEEIKKYLVNRSPFTRKEGKNSPKPFVIVTPNPEQIVFAKQNKEFADILDRAAVMLPDGQGIVWALRFFSRFRVDRGGDGNVKRVPGIEFMEDLAQLAVLRRVRIGLIGGFGGLAVRALECLRQKYPTLAGWAQDGPELATDADTQLNRLGKDYWVRLGDKLINTRTQILFVGLGAPKQEYFIARLVREFETSHLKFPIILMSVGGSFDLLTGRVKRAPALLRSIGFEWLWRLLQEPWRIRRQLALLKFVGLVLQERLS